MIAAKVGGLVEWVQEDGCRTGRGDGSLGTWEWLSRVVPGFIRMIVIRVGEWNSL